MLINTNGTIITWHLLGMCSVSDPLALSIDFLPKPYEDVMIVFIL